MRDIVCRVRRVLRTSAVFASRKTDLLVLLVICFAAFWWRLGTLGLIDPDEPFYAQTAREMVHSGDWLTPRIYGAPQFEKPILYYWLVAGSFTALGETEFAGRMPTAVFATVLVLLVWWFGSRVWNPRAGFLAALVLAMGLEFCVMSRLMLTDIPLAAFIAAAVFCSWLAARHEEQRDKWMFWHLVWAGFAVLTKGPLGSLVTVMATVAFSLGMKRPLPFRGRGFWWGVVAYAVVVVPWYAAMFAWHARPFWEEFFIRDNWLRVIRAEHPANNHLWYYPGLLFLGSLPWMPAVALTMRRAWGRLRADEAAFFQWCWLLTSLVFLTICQSKLPSYAFFLFVPLALLIGRTLDDFLTQGFATSGERRLVLGCAVLQCAVVGVFVALPCVPWLAERSTSLTKMLRPFEVPVLMVFGCLGVSVVLLLLKKHAIWLLASSTASLALLVGALTVALPAVEAESSARPVAQALMRVRHGDEPLLTGPFLARGIIYYTNTDITARDPALRVLAKKEQPFWAAHPIPVVVWKKGLNRFLEEHPSALCALRKSDWRSFADEEAFAAREDFSEIGENVVVRALRKKPMAVAE